MLPAQSPLTLIALASAGAAVAAAVLVPPTRPSPPPALPSAAGSVASQPETAACPPGSLPDDGICVPVPRLEASGAVAAATAPDIPRRPDRDVPLERYLLPVATDAPGDGSLPPALAAHAADPRGGAFVEASFRARVAVPRLEGQRGPTMLLFAVDLFGPTAVTIHRVGEAGRERDYILLIGNLDTLPEASPGPLDGLLGHVGSGASGGIPGVYLELRRARAGFAVAGARVEDLRAAASTVTVDVRNLLPPR